MSDKALIKKGARDDDAMTSPPPAYCCTARFATVSTGDFASALLLRSDGAVVRTLHGRMSGVPVNPPPGVKYIQVACGRVNSYLLRDDGAVDRVQWRRRGGLKLANTIHPPAGQRYLSVAAGIEKSLLLREDGAVDVTKGGGIVSSTFNPPSGEWCAPVVMNRADGHMVRSDEILADRAYLSSRGPIDVRKLTKSEFKTGLPSARNDNRTGSSNIIACVRSDGGADYIKCGSNGAGNRTVASVAVPTANYVASSTISCASYLLRADGAVDRVVKHGTVAATIRPPLGVTYIQVSAGRRGTYLVRSDGCVDRTVRFGRIRTTLSVPPNCAPRYIESCRMAGQSWPALNASFNTYE